MLVHDRTFRTKTECEEFFKRMLNRYGPGDTVSAQDARYLLALLDYHDEAEAKIGCGVAGFRVELEPVYRKYCHFLIVRHDGSTEDFSYKKCISKPRDRHLPEVLKAFRSDIQDQVFDFRRAAYGTRKYVRCAITNLNVRMQDAHVDHKPPKTFQRLMYDFLKGAGLSVDSIRVGDLDHLGLISCRTIADPSVREAWRQYHRDHAELQITLDHANLGQAKSKIDFDTL